MNPEQPTPNATPANPGDGTSSADADRAALEAIQALESEEATFDEPLQEGPLEPVIESTPATPLVVAEPQPTPEPIQPAPRPMPQPEQVAPVEAAVLTEPEPTPVAVQAPSATPAATPGYNPFETTKKPTSKATIVTIVVLLVAVLAVGGYVVWKYVLPGTTL